MSGQLMPQSVKIKDSIVGREKGRRKTMWFWPIFGVIIGIGMIYESIGRKEYLDLLIATGYIETETEPIGIVIGIAILIVSIWRIITILKEK